MTYERGPLVSYEVTWASGHVETIQAHQCIMPMPRSPFLPGGGDDEPRRIMFHGEVDGHWQLILAAPEAEIAVVRNVSTAQESL